MLSLAFLILMCASLAGIAYLVLRRVPALSQIPQEAIANQETFFAFMVRVMGRILSAMSPRRIRMFILTKMAEALNSARAFFFKIYHTIETMAKTTREKSQKMDWEHHWFSRKEVAREEERLAATEKE